MSFDVTRFEQAVGQQLAQVAEQQAASAAQQGIADAVGGPAGEALGGAAGELVGVGADQARAAADGRAGEGLDRQLADVARSQATSGAGALGEVVGGEEGREAATRAAGAANQAIDQATSSDAAPGAAPGGAPGAAPPPSSSAPAGGAPPASGAGAPASGGAASGAPSSGAASSGAASPAREAAGGPSPSGDAPAGGAAGGAPTSRAPAGGASSGGAPSGAAAPAGGSGTPAGARRHVPALDTSAGTQAPGDLTQQVGDRWATALTDAWDGLTKPLDPNRSTAQHAADVLRRTQSLVAAAWDTFNLPGDMINAAVAQLMQPLANMVSPMPAITLGKMWMSIPHVHNHPPTFTPPAPPVPLPAVGSVLLGTSVRVLINSMPAARVKDIGIAPTCTGFTPFFQIKMGSSNVFIGGTRAARIIDLAFVCGSGEERETDNKFLQKLAAAAEKIDGVVSKIGMGVAVLGIAADAAEAATEDDAAMSAAKAMAAGMGAAQLVADQAAAAMTKSMGKDPAMTPPMVPGMFLMGSPTVQIGGFPMIHIPNPAELLLNKLKAFKPRRPRTQSEDDSQPRRQGNTSCPP